MLFIDLWTAHTNAHTCPHVHEHTWTYVYIHTCTQTCTHTHMQACTYTCFSHFSIASILLRTWTIQHFTFMLKIQSNVWYICYPEQLSSISEEKNFANPPTACSATREERKKKTNKESQGWASLTFQKLSAQFSFLLCKLGGTWLNFNLLSQLPEK